MKAVAYTRVSTEKSEQELSLEHQREMLKQYAERHGDELIEVYADAADIIGLNQNPKQMGVDLVLFFHFLQELG